MIKVFLRIKGIPGYDIFTEVFFKKLVGNKEYYERYKEYYKRYKLGDIIKFGGKQYEIVKSEPFGVYIKTPEGKIERLSVFDLG